MSQQYIYQNINQLDKYWNKFFLGLFIYQCGNILYDFILNESFIGRIISLIGILIMFLYICKIPKINPLKKNKFITSVLCFYIFINVITVFRGIFHSNIGGIILHPFYFWQYVLPFIIFLKLPNHIIPLLYKWSFIYVIVALLFSIYNFNDFYFNAAELIKSMDGWEGYILNRPQIPCTLSIPICLFLFNWKNIKTSHKIIICVTLTLAILAALFAGRRSAATTIIYFLLVILTIKIKHHFGKIFVAIFLIAFFTIQTQPNVLPYLSEKFPILSERLDTNSREGVEDDFYKDFKDASDWILGRGMHGTYRCPSLTDITDINRNVIETGFLNIILHGGLLLLIPYVYILIYAINKIRKSVNQKYKKISMITYFFFHIIFLYPGGNPQLNLQFVTLWILISITLTSTKPKQFLLA